MFEAVFEGTLAHDDMLGIPLLVGTYYVPRLRDGISLATDSLRIRLLAHSQDLVTPCCLCSALCPMPSPRCKIRGEWRQYAGDTL